MLLRESRQRRKVSQFELPEPQIYELLRPGSRLWKAE
jgi:hypothetical protein